MKSVFIVLGVLTLVASLLGGVWAGYAVGNEQQARVEATRAAWAKMTHPPTTRFIEAWAGFGRGADQRCGWLVGELRGTMRAGADERDAYTTMFPDLEFSELGPTSAPVSMPAAHAFFVDAASAHPRGQGETFFVVFKFRASEDQNDLACWFAR